MSQVTETTSSSCSPLLTCEDKGIIKPVLLVCALIAIGLVALFWCPFVAIALPFIIGGYCAKVKPIAIEEIKPIADSDGKGASHDPQAAVGRLQALFAQKKPENRQKAQSGDIPHPRRRRQARARSAVL